MNTQNNSQSIKYTTDLEYPKTFFLVLPQRRYKITETESITTVGITNGTIELKPLCVGDYIRLPVNELEGLNNTFKVTAINSKNHVSLELIMFRLTEVEDVSPVKQKTKIS